MSQNTIHAMQKKALCAAALSLAFGGAALAQVSPTAQTAAGATSAPAGTAATSAASGTNSGALSSADRKFIHNAAIGGMAEVQLGNLAQQKATHDQVKQFGARMVEDHSKANDELKQVADSKGVQLPTSLDRKNQKTMEKLQKLSGASFDREYMKDMVADHKKDIAEFQKAAKSAKDNDVKGFAAKTLPTLREHLQMAQTTEKALRSSKSGSSSNSNSSNSGSSSNSTPSSSGGGSSSSKP